jgi:hypothetical protein
LIRIGDIENQPLEALGGLSLETLSIGRFSDAGEDVVPSGMQVESTGLPDAGGGTGNEDRSGS